MKKYWLTHKKQTNEIIIWKQNEPVYWTEPLTFSNTLSNKDPRSTLIPTACDFRYIFDNAIFNSDDETEILEQYLLEIL